jgi:hypothetical protein
MRVRWKLGRREIFAGLRRGMPRLYVRDSREIPEIFVAKGILRLARRGELAQNDSGLIVSTAEDRLWHTSASESIPPFAGPEALHGRDARAYTSQ